MKNYNRSPLPFKGQKRRFLKSFKRALGGYPKDAIYVDLFGGSGLLSHTVKSTLLNATVIYNDYDNFNRRLKAIPQTNAILHRLREILANYQKDRRIEGKRRDEVIKVLKLASAQGYVDWISISSSLLFPMNYSTRFEEFIKQTLYNKVRRADFQADGYLQGVEVVSEDYRTLFNRYKDKPNVVFLVDPPYLSTDCNSYSSYWKLKDYLEVLQVLVNQSYFYFTSNKSQIMELCEWISSVSATANPFENATVDMCNASCCIASKYTDIMYHYKVS